MQVHLKTIHDSSAAVAWAGPRTVVVDRTPREGGQGIGFNGGELLLMAIGACYCNDLYRDAAAFDVQLEQVEIIVNGDWGGTPVHAQNVRYDVKVRANASREQVEALLKHTDQQAEVLHTLRTGTPLKLNSYEISR
ncbi:OsmC family protein [Chitinophaga japonensis]|uniref:Putative OsmC-like protein n=1 Tax=Chitinophaga japonensis TaxID=104662 RepID=A0A562SJQ0_CHIJA|nr:OsmC family protein [Chitinophaga japonensis]TWI81020.1 putative OsmC-like protein [Chitinophaga japonensis]